MDARSCDVWLEDVLPLLLRSGQQKQDRATLVREKGMSEKMVTVHKVRAVDTIHSN